MIENGGARRCRNAPPSPSNFSERAAAACERSVPDISKPLCPRFKRQAASLGIGRLRANQVAACRTSHAAGLARRGGHKNNGPPGWQVRGRGYATLLMFEAGFKVGQSEACDQS